MENINLENGYEIRRITTTNKIVEKLCEKCSDYYILHEGILPTREEIAEIFTALPPNKAMCDKYVLGIYSLDTLVGIMDIVKDFPTEGEWMLGLMLIDPIERGNGLGKKIHKEICEWATGLGATSFRIGVIQDNYNGIKFWSTLGYQKIKEVEMQYKQRDHLVNVMRLVLV